MTQVTDDSQTSALDYAPYPSEVQYDTIFDLVYLAVH